MIQKTFILLMAAIIMMPIAACSRSASSGQVSGTNVVGGPDTMAATPGTVNVVSSDHDDELFDGKRIERPDEEWRRSLTPEQYYVLREEGTERAFSGEYDDNHAAGFYHCAACHLKLFSSKTKFDSGTGWPSFYQPINDKNVTEKAETAFGVTRTEVECSRCGSHLGHVFDDGPKPTGLRYCMNSLALKFERSE